MRQQSLFYAHGRQKVNVALWQRAAGAASRSRVNLLLLDSLFCLSIDSDKLQELVQDASCHAPDDGLRMAVEIDLTTSLGPGVIASARDQIIRKILAGDRDHLSHVACWRVLRKPGKRDREDMIRLRRGEGAVIIL